MKFTLIDFGIVCIFFVFNLLLLHLLNINFGNKNSKLIDIKKLLIALVNTIIIGVPMVSIMGLYIHTIIAFVVYLVEFTTMYKFPMRKSIFITTLIVFVLISIDNLFNSVSGIMLHQGGYDHYNRIALTVTYTVLTLIVLILFKKLKADVVDIIVGSRIQAKLSNFMIITAIIILNIIAVFETRDINVFYNVSSFCLTIFLMMIVYIVLVYGYKVSLDIWNNASKNITTADLEMNSNSEFDLSMYRNIDILSGLYNREFGLEKLKEYLNGDIMICLVFININNFEIIKSAHGQEWQDKYVKVVAETLKATYRDNDFIFRFSDSKFMVILENCPIVAGDKTTSRAYNRVRQYSKEVGGDINMAISFGCEEYHPNSGTTLNDIENTSETKMSEFNLKKNDIMDVTGVYNKKFGLNVIEDVCYKRQNFSICIFQINQIKAIETMYGSHEMETIISIIGNTVIESFRARDTVSRFTYNQFITIMPFCGEREAKEVFAQVYNDILKVFKDKKKPYGIDITNFITEYSSNTEITPNQLFVKIQDKLGELLEAELATKKNKL